MVNAFWRAAFVCYSQLGSGSARGVVDGAFNLEFGEPTKVNDSLSGAHQHLPRPQPDPPFPPHASRSSAHHPVTATVAPCSSQAQPTAPVRRGRVADVGCEAGTRRRRHAPTHRHHLGAGVGVTDHRAREIGKDSRRTISTAIPMPGYQIPLSVWTISITRPPLFPK